MKRAILASAVLLVLAAVAFVAAAPLLVRAIVVGNGDAKPADFDARASAEARALVARALAGLAGSQLFDVHAHVAGSDADGSGCEIDPSMRSWAHPWRRLQFTAYLAAARVDDLDRGAAQFADRLLEVSRGRVGVLAIDRRYGADGEVDRAGTALYVPNDHVLRLAAEHPDRFVPVVSVHPYRRDALEELDRCAARGARIVKWLPNSMGIDPADPRCDPFYARMKARGMALLAHAGDEHALAAGDDELGNPARLRRALDAGVRVIVAHCATLGDHFDDFLRLMEEPRYEELAYGDLSAVCLRNRDARVLRTLLERTDLHPRLVEGSDWPLPAIRMLTSTRRLASDGFITPAEREALDEIFRYDPWLFDLVLKRTVRGPHGERFPDSAFLAPPWLAP